MCLQGNIMKVKLAELDITYQAMMNQMQQNYADLLTKVLGKRVHGIHGSDAAHKACANSTTDRFVTVDGDNTLRQEFINPSFRFQ